MKAFHQQHAIITGGSSGIGKAVAILLAKEGCHVSIIARKQEMIDSALEEIQGARANPEQRIQGYSADVSIQRNIQQAIHTCIEKNGPPDILITSAGTAIPGHFADIPEDTFVDVMNTNYFGTLYAIKAVAPIMQAKKSGHIVLISSGTALVGIFGYTTYSPTKFAVRGLAEALRPELKPYGVRVSIAYPPNTDTPLLTEERKTAPRETNIISNLGGTYTVDKVAKDIVQGIKKNKFIIASGIQMRLLAPFHSLILPVLNWYFDKLIK